MMKQLRDGSYNLNFLNECFRVFAGASFLLFHKGRQMILFRDLVAEQLDIKE